MAGAPAAASGAGLQPGSIVTVLVHSTPRVLGRFTVGSGGSFSGAITLPADLEAGRHTLIVRGTSASGAQLERSSQFIVTGKGNFGLPVYVAADHPGQTKRTVIGTMALVLVAGGLGVTTTAMGGASVASRRRSGSTRKSGSWAASRTVKREGDESEVDVSHQTQDEEPHEIGDRSSTYRAPGTAWLDKHFVSLPNRVARVSPLLARVVNDGSYLRAMFGSLALLVPLAGLILGVLAGFNTVAEAVAPATGLAVAIIVLGIADVLAGFLAALTFSIVVLAQGGVHGVADVRSLIDTDIVFFAVIMVVSATRDLRRQPASSAEEWYDRVSDIVVGGLLGMWVLSKAVGALPGLAGVAVPLADHTERVAFVALACVVVRYCAETLATHWYPLRLTKVAPLEVDDPPRPVQWFGMIAKAAVFAFFAESYLGNVWELYVGAALLLLSMALAANEDVLPNWPVLRKAIPAGMIAVIFAIAVGNWAYEALGHVITDPNQLAAWSFFMISIPFLIVQVIESSARNGEGWAQNWWTRALGLPTLVFTVLVAQGLVSLG